ncbi:MAG: hypothetical protein IJZ93_05650 [Clostridia bacterium]|nr:hypothetical protein [Clostridia bacterium]
MKKLLVALSLLVVVFALLSCSRDESEPDASKDIICSYVNSSADASVLSEKLIEDFALPTLDTDITLDFGNTVLTLDDGLFKKESDSSVSYKTLSGEYLISIDNGIAKYQMPQAQFLNKYYIYDIKTVAKYAKYVSLPTLTHDHIKEHNGEYVISEDYIESVLEIFMKLSLNYAGASSEWQSVYDLYIKTILNGTNFEVALKLDGESISSVSIEIMADANALTCFNESTEYKYLYAKISAEKSTQGVTSLSFDFDITHKNSIMRDIYSADAKYSYLEDTVCGIELDISSSVSSSYKFNDVTTVYFSTVTDIGAFMDTSVSIEGDTALDYHFSEKNEGFRVISDGKEIEAGAIFTDPNRLDNEMRISAEYVSDVQISATLQDKASGSGIIYGALSFDGIDTEKSTAVLNMIDGASVLYELGNEILPHAIEVSTDDTRPLAMTVGMYQLYIVFDTGKEIFYVTDTLPDNSIMIEYENGSVVF